MPTIQKHLSLRWSEVMETSCCGAALVPPETGIVVKAKSIKRKSYFGEILLDNRKYHSVKIGLGHAFVFYNDNNPEHT